jgi:hypothetical protein
MHLLSRSSHRAALSAKGKKGVRLTGVQKVTVAETGYAEARLEMRRNLRPGWH